jgi:hypothetical protein
MVPGVSVCIMVVIAKRFSLATKRKGLVMAKPRLGKRERAEKRAEWLAKATNPARPKSDGLVSMSVGSYGPSCMIDLQLFRPGPKQWGYNGRTAGRIHRKG